MGRFARNGPAPARPIAGALKRPTRAVAQFRVTIMMRCLYKNKGRETLGERYND